MAANVAEFTDGNFKTEVLESQEPVLVDFWAPWCGPCRMIAPLIEQLATQYTGSVKIGKLNIDDSPSAPGQYGVNSIPTLMVFKNGAVVDSIVGAPSKDRLVSLLDRVK